MGSDTDRLRLVLERALELREEGQSIDVRRLCAGQEALIPELQAALDLAPRLANWQAQSTQQGLEVGELVAQRYQLMELLGAGSMGVVYSAKDLKLNRRVALKLLRSAHLVEEEAQERFLREAQALAAIVHPAVVTIYDRGQSERDQRFLVMEELEGCSLADLIETGAERYARDAIRENEWMKEELGLVDLQQSNYWRLVASWGAQLASGLQVAHERGIHHRDVKPSNVFLRRDGSPVLLDFGIAAWQSRETVAERDSALGTPAYMPPEALGGARVGVRGDVYGLCATLYHLLVFEAPYVGHPPQVIAALSRRDPRPMQALRAGIPRDLRAIVERGMSRDVARRYASCAELEEDLRAFLEHRPVSARPVTSVERGWRQLKSSRAFQAVVGTLLLLAFSVCSFQLHDEWIESRRGRALELWSHVPPMLTLWAPENRYIESLSEREALRALLDELVEVSPDVFPGRLYRAGFRMDHGETEGVLDDLSAVAAYVDSDLGHSLLERVRGSSHEAGARSFPAVRELPAARSAWDHYLCAYLELRGAREAQDYARVEAHLGNPGLTDVHPAQEMRLPTLLTLAFNLEGTEERREALRGVHEQALRLEERIGSRTATTAHVIGSALGGQEFYGESLPALRDGVELAPSFHGLRSNLAIAARRLGRFDEAREQLEVAIDLRPEALKAYLTLSMVLIKQGAHDEARALILAAPFKAEQRHRQVYVLGEIEAARALEHKLAGEVELAREAAREALLIFAGVPESGPAYSGRPLELARGIAQGDDSRVLGALLRSLPTEPTNWRLLDAVIDRFPEQLSPSETADTRQYLSSLRDHYAQRSDPGQAFSF